MLILGHQEVDSCVYPDNEQRTGRRHTAMDFVGRKFSNLEGFRFPQPTATALARRSKLFLSWSPPLSRDSIPGILLVNTVLLSVTHLFIPVLAFQDVCCCIWRFLSGVLRV